MNSIQGGQPSAITPAIQHILNKTGAANGAVVPHDPTNPQDVMAFETLANAHGITAARYPALHQRFRAQKPLAPFANAKKLSENTGAFTDNQKLDYIATVTGGKASAHATLTRTKAVSQIFCSLSVVNVTGATTTVLATGTKTYLDLQTVEIVTNDSTAQPMVATGTNYGVFSWSVQYADGTGDTNHQSTQWSYQAAADPVVTAPVQNPNRHSGDLNDIVIGLSRGVGANNKTDIDYWFWQTQVSNNTLLSPLQGSMKFLYPIAPLNATNPVLEFYLARTEGGMNELNGGATAPYMSGFTIDSTDSTKINFSLMANPNDAGNAINFGVSPWVADTRTFLTVRVTVAFQNPAFGTGWSSILSSTTANVDDADGVTYIKPIVYVWHCVAAGSLITMSDGSTKAVELCDSNDVVQSGATTRTVLATPAQPHWGVVYVITLANGATLTCSGTHPFITPAGPQQASALVAGSTVSVAGGTSTVSAITQQQQSGAPLFNLWLDPGPAGQTIMTVNGIVVGDYQMQVALLQSAQTDPARLRAAIPEYLHTDLASYLEDRAASVT
jgi:hypothetical protein